MVDIQKNAEQQSEIVKRVVAAAGPEIKLIYVKRGQEDKYSS